MKNNKQCPKENNLTENNDVNGMIDFIDYSPEMLMKYCTKELPLEEINAMKRVIQAYPIYKQELIYLNFMLDEYNNDIDQIIDYADSFEIDVEQCLKEVEKEIGEEYLEQKQSLNVENRQKQINNLLIEEQVHFSEKEMRESIPTSQAILKKLENEWNSINQLRQKLDQERYEIDQIQQRLNMEQYHLNQSRQRLEIEKNNIKKLSKEIQEEQFKYQLYTQQLELERLNFIQANSSTTRTFDDSHHDSRTTPSEDIAGRSTRSRPFNFKKYK